MSTIEENISTYMDSICSQSIVILKNKKTPLRYSECETDWTFSSSRLNYLNTPVKVQPVEDSSELLFLKSLIPDFKKLNNKNQRRFKHSVLSTLVHNEQEI
ncbi:BESS motif [Cinara cedri]|uniref:BESS motif n=1 Tax=Cinara cedri TaxID=506608 RepID=A0A5E4MCI9_9HEMI|nr:BESS motif [Cinara cedri]